MDSKKMKKTGLSKSVGSAHLTVCVFQHFHNLLLLELLKSERGNSCGRGEVVEIEIADGDV